MSSSCALCHGRLHVRIAMGRWERCPNCFRKAASLVFIKSDIRGRTEAIAPEIEAMPALPLDDVSVIHPNPTFFRQWVWRSLLDYEQRDLVYDYLDGSRLVDINFQRDPVYQTLREVQELPLIIVDFSATRTEHSYLGPVFVQILRIRQRMGRPTWCYATDIEMLRRYYDAETVAHVNATLMGRAAAVADLAMASPMAAPKSSRYDPNAV